MIPAKGHAPALHPLNMAVMGTGESLETDHGSSQ